MAKLKSNNTFLTQIIVAASVLLLGVNAALGIALTRQSASAMRAQIEMRMLDVAKSAAALLDGDALARLSERDAGTPAYEQGLATLRAFQDEVELAFIYCVRDMGDGTFSFTLDPADDPGGFGEPVPCTDALYAASRGTPAVDKTSYEDRWGRFYSAYSPVFDSKGEVAGIVAVDFDAAWYDQQVSAQIYTILVAAVLSMLIGGAVVFVITMRLRRRLADLDVEISRLTDDMKELAGELLLASGRDAAEEKRVHAKPDPSGAGDSIEALNAMVHSVREEMRSYIADAHALAYTDAMTGVSNRAAYLKAVDRLNREIARGTAAFSIALFDVNGLKQVNDMFGHEYGDKLIIDAAIALKAIFDDKSVYRIGGDEFIAVLEGASPEYAGSLLAALDEKIAAMPLSVSKGTAEYEKGKDFTFTDIFRRADEAMYRDKAAYYAKHGRRRNDNRQTRNSEE